MSLETYLFYLAAVAVFFATPPDTSQLLVISNSIRHGLRRTLLTISGDLIANCLQMTAAAFGLAAVISQSATAFQTIKWAGVLYLAWIGFKLLFSGGDDAAAAARRIVGVLPLFRQGFFTSLANPFAVIFFAALFPQFIDPTQPVLPQLSILGATYLAVDGAILLFWGWSAVGAARLLRRHSLGLVNRVCGALMIAAAALLSSKDFRPQN